jgi:hypothetical protein
VSAPEQQRPDPPPPSDRPPFGGVNRKDALGLVAVMGVVFLVVWLLRTFGGY